MNIVADASSIGLFFFPDQEENVAQRAIALVKESLLVEPAHWPIELAGLALRAARRVSASAGEKAAARALLIAFVENARLEPATNAIAALDLAAKHHISVYDAAYLELALRMNLPLLTGDTALQNAAKRTKALLAIP